MPSTSLPVSLVSIYGDFHLPKTHLSEVCIFDITAMTWNDAAPQQYRRKNVIQGTQGMTYTTPSNSEIETLINKAHRLRAEMIANFFRGLFRRKPLAKQPVAA